MTTRNAAAVLAGLTLGGMLLAAVGVAAQESPPAPALPPHTSLERSNPSSIGHQMEEAVRGGQFEEESRRLFGPLLKSDCGVHLEPVYWGEVFSNTRGGISTRDATRYQGLLDLALIADLEKLGSPFEGDFFILAQNTHGRGLTEDFVGDSLVLSNIDSLDNRLQVSEYWLEIHVVEDDLRVRLGKQDINSEFLVVDLAGDFIQSGFGISPHLAVPAYPDPSAAAVVLADVTDHLQAKAGVWDGVSDGRNWGFSGTGMTLVIGELEYRYELDDGRLPGTIDCGALYLSAGEVQPGEYQPQGWGIYLDFEQLVWRENADDEQGLGFFVQYSNAAPDEEVGFPEYFGAGVVYEGLVSGRDQDGLGVGVAAARLNGGGTGRETVVEWYYRAEVRPGVVLEPDVQYIASPSGIYRDSLVVGLRFILSL
ncbi:MAG: carbohydrate porin [Thermoguttaceae bacterium]